MEHQMLGYIDPVEEVCSVAVAISSQSAPLSY
jgi:hypothetical protein